MAKAPAKETKAQPETKQLKGSSPFVDQSNAYEAFDQSRKWIRTYFQPLDELERIARNKPSPNIDPTLPRVTDGTTASIVQETPKRYIQQLATGVIDCRDKPEYGAIADMVHRYRLLPMYNRMGTALQKHWGMGTQALTYGSSCSYTFFTNTQGQFHTDFVIPYRKDIITEKGKVYAPDSNVMFMRSWYQKRDLQAIINKEKKLMADNKDYQSEWDLKLLAEFMESGPSTKPAEDMTPAEKEKGDGYAGGYEVIHCFQKGVKSEFYSFAPRFEQGKTLRVKLNRDPRGLMPLDFEYCNIDFSNPLGRGVVELSGGVQNLIDQQMQLYQFLSTLMMAPPLQVWGNVDKAKLKFRPNAVWDMGNSPTNKVEAYQADNTQITNFVGNIQFLQSRIFSLNGNADNSIPSKDNAVGQSKTQAGVQANQERLGIADNYLEKQHEAWLAAQSATSVNLFFAEMTGSEDIPVGKEDIRLLEGTPAAPLLDKQNNTLKVNYKEISDMSFSFKTDPGSSKEVDSEAQLTRIQELLQDVSQNGLVIQWYLGQTGKKLNVGEIYRQEYEYLDLKNIDTILQDMTPQEAEAAKSQPFPIIDKPQIRINSADLSPDDLKAALGAGGVYVQPPQQGQPATDPLSAASAQAQLDYHVELIKAQAAGTSQSPAPTGADPNELALKQQEMDIKKQNANDNSTKLALDIAKTAHQHTLDLHNAAQPTPPQDPNVPNTPQDPNEANETPQQESAEPLAQQEQEISQDLGSALSQQETQIVEELFKRGFSEQDAEQAVVMLRQGHPPEQIIQVLGGKYNAAQA